MFSQPRDFWFLASGLLFAAVFGLAFQESAVTNGLSNTISVAEDAGRDATFQCAYTGAFSRTILTTR